MPYGPKPRPAAERFEAHVQRTASCWLWTASTRSAGYGQFWDGERIRLAHRFAYEQAYGPVPDGLRVLHECDNPLCVRPDHLWLGTQAENLADMRAKGRAAPQPGTKLTRELAAEIRRRCADGETQQSVADSIGTTRSNVSSIVRGRTWREATTRIRR
jgi:hypothetical protein